MENLNLYSFCPESYYCYSFWHVQKFWKASLIFGKLKNINQLLLFLFKSYLKEKGLPRWLSGKESTCQARDTGSIPGSGRSPRGGNRNPLQNSCLGNPMDGEAWWATVHGVTKSQTQLSSWAHLREKKVTDTVFLFLQLSTIFLDSSWREKNWLTCRKELIFNCLVNSYKLEDLGKRQ